KNEGSEKIDEEESIEEPLSEEIEQTEEVSEVKEELPEEEIINNEEDLTEEDKAMYEGYLDKVDNHAEEDLSEEEKAMYHSYLNGEQSSNIEETETTEQADVKNDELQEEVKENDKKDDLKDDDILEEKEMYKKHLDKTVDEDIQSILSTNDAKIDEIRDSDLNMLENIIKGNEEEDGEELIRINNSKVNENDDKDETKAVKSVENFDSMEELLNKETNMSEEKELQTIEKDNVDSSVAVEDEFKLGDDNGPILIEEEHKPSNDSDDDDFDGEITQSDLDYAIKLFESEETSGSSNEYSSKQDILLSENEINKFKKLFCYFKNIVEKMSPEDLNDFSKTEFYDMYSSLFRKFGD
ncbi:hypothetical protein, partial [Brachyspira sp. G79]|uniref:hypothetical protein n=1 Tax=Brachyspira sp. G79 TaxID=1358104 RepID=UPI000BD2F22C